MRIVQQSARIAGRGAVRRFGIGAAALMVGLAMAGCQDAVVSSGGTGQQITVAMVPSAFNTPVQVGIDRGTFSRYGVTVKMARYATLQRAYAALANGQAQVLSGDYADLLYKASTTPATPLRIVADGYDATAGMLQVLTLPNSGIESPQQLVGKRVGTPPASMIPFSRSAPYSAETLATDAVLESAGVSPSSIRWKQVQTIDIISALRDRTVDAVVAPEPYILQAESGFGAVELLDSCSGITANLPIAGYFATANYASAHEAALRDFQKGLTVAQGLSSQRGVIEPMIRGMAGMDAQEAALVTLGVYPTFLNVGQIQRVADIMFSQGLTHTDLAVKPMVSG